MLDSTSFHNTRSHFSFNYTLLRRLLGRPSILLFCDSCQYQFSWPRQRWSSTRRAPSCEASSSLCGLRSLSAGDRGACSTHRSSKTWFLLFRVVITLVFRFKSVIKCTEHLLPVILWVDPNWQVRFLKTHPRCMEKLKSLLISRLDLYVFSFPSPHPRIILS